MSGIPKRSKSPEKSVKKRGRPKKKVGSGMLKRGWNFYI